MIKEKFCNAITFQGDKSISGQFGYFVTIRSKFCLRMFQKIFILIPIKITFDFVKNCLDGNEKTYVTMSDKK